MKNISRRRFVGLALASSSLAIGGSVQAASHTLTAPEARALLEAGDIVILDIRSREEWQETGIAMGAWPVSMHEAAFGANLIAVLGNYRPDQIALICATGGRSNFVVQRLGAQGILGLRDIPEGMMGYGDAPGWIARGLPITALQNMETEFQAAKRSWAQN